MKGTDGRWRGLTVDLWTKLAADLGLRYRLVERRADEILDAVARGTLDTAAGPFAATLERQQLLDFSIGYVVNGVGIAVLRSREEDRWLAVVEALTTPTALKLYLAVAAMTFFAGAALWLLERRRNPMFAGRPLDGVGSGFWWAGVTTVGVGYGDKVPITFWGRLTALLWMFVSLVLITALTAFVTARLALAEIGRVRGPASLRASIVGAVEGAAATDFLRREDVPHRLYPSGDAALAALERREVQAVVYGKAILRYYAERDPRKRYEVLPDSLEAQTYAFPLRDGSPLREPMNAALRRAVAETHFRDLRDRYLGGAEPSSER
jgi:polar amino acid transport system substrate-binding protein